MCGINGAGGKQFMLARLFFVYSFPSCVSLFLALPVLFLVHLLLFAFFFFCSHIFCPHLNFKFVPDSSFPPPATIAFLDYIINHSHFIFLHVSRSVFLWPHGECNIDDSIYKDSQPEVTLLSILRFTVKEKYEVF